VFLQFKITPCQSIRTAYQKVIVENKRAVSPDLYTEDYFLTDNEGHAEYLKGLDDNIHPKFRKALKLAAPLEGDNILDVGCGRGELLYYCAKKGAKALGIDYSKAAIEVAKKTIKKLPAHLQQLAQAHVGDITDYAFNSEYDIAYMIEVAEHMHDWQLIAAFKKIHAILKDSGKLVIVTPNYYYEKYLSPIKRTAALPWNMIKWPLRVLRGKYKPEGPADILGKIFRIGIDRGEVSRTMHANITTRSKLKSLLRDFDSKIYCEDHSKNPISLITRKWWGRDIIVVARKSKFLEQAE